VTPRRRLQNCLVSLVFQTITIMADVGLPLVSRRSPQRGDRSRPHPIVTISSRNRLYFKVGIGGLLSIVINEQYQGIRYRTACQVDGENGTAFDARSIYNWIKAFFHGLSHCTKFAEAYAS